MATAAVEFSKTPGPGTVRLTGDWILSRLPESLEFLQAELRGYATLSAAWEMSRVTRLDSAGAVVLWQAWGRQWPATLVATDEQREILARAAAISPALVARLPSSPLTWLAQLGRLLLSAGKNARDITASYNFV